jgi:hypothetical protein
MRGTAAVPGVEEDAVLVRGLRVVDADDVGGVGLLEANLVRGLGGRFQALQRAALLEALHGHQRRGFELAGEPALQRALDLRSLRGRQTLDRQDLLQELTKADGHLSHLVAPASMSGGPEASGHPGAF